MIIDILTLFPDMFTGIINNSIIKRAIEKGIVEINIHDFREYSKNKHKKVDDTPYGGGAGMLLTLQPIVDCLKAIPNYQNAIKILTTATGKKYDQDCAEKLVQVKHLIILCGHYEGFDERITNYIDQEISIGDFILTGGEIPALTIIDSVIRLLPEAITSESIIDESFTSSLLEYPQYTKPAVYDGYAVPDVLISGNHEEIRKYRRYMALKRTYEKRPDLINKEKLNVEDLKFLEKIKKGE